MTEIPQSEANEPKKGGNLFDAMRLIKTLSKGNVRDPVAVWFQVTEEAVEPKPAQSVTVQESQLH